MWKSLVIFVVCLVTVCCVWGLNDRLNYEGFKTAIEHVEGSINTVVNDLSSFSAFAFAIENFDPGSNDNSIYVKGRYVTLEFAGEAEVFVFSSPSQAHKISHVLAPLTYTAEVGEGAFKSLASALNASLFWLGVITTILVLLVVILLDFVGVAWSLIQSALYLIGVGSVGA